MLYSLISLYLREGHSRTAGVFWSTVWRTQKREMLCSNSFLISDPAVSWNTGFLRDLSLRVSLLQGGNKQQSCLPWSRRTVPRHGHPAQRLSATECREDEQMEKEWSSCWYLGLLSSPRAPLDNNLAGSNKP